MNLIFLQPMRGLNEVSFDGLSKDTDIRIIQDLLGHSSIKTTEIYTHVALNKRPISPLTELGL